MRLQQKLPLALILITGLLMPLTAASASGASSGPAWTIRSLAQPTDFSPASNGDSYTLLVTNVGNAAAQGPIVISDTLPAGVHAQHAPSVVGEDLSDESSQGFECTEATLGPVQCVQHEEVPPGHTLRMEIDVAVEAGASGGACAEDTSSRCVENAASVSGGGAAAVATSEQTPLREEQAGFGIKEFSMQALNADGTTDTQAAGHPYTLTTTFALNTDNNAIGEGTTIHTPEELKDVVVDLPQGLLGNPQDTPRCPLFLLLKTTAESGCPPNTAIGTIVFEAAPGRFRASSPHGSETTAVYNMAPEAGYQAEFGFTYLGSPVFIYARAVRMGATYGIQVTVPGIPELHTAFTSLTLFGEPAERNGGTSSPAPFFTNPVDCSSGSTPARVEVDTWQHPGHYYSQEVESFPTMTGCEMLQFQPRLQVAPETTQADEPSGYGFEIESPQNESPFSPGTPELRDATVTLPPGVSVSPSAANGLDACQATGAHGIGIPAGDGTARDVGEGEELGADGFPHLTPGHCPGASTIGTVEITTPLLEAPLKGHVFVGQPGCGGEGQAPCTPTDAADGNLVHLYLEAAGSGVVIKLPGEVTVNQATGQLTAHFKENPQFPFSELKLHFEGGPRASLANPLSCGVATTTSDLSPWSGGGGINSTPDGTPVAAFTVSWDGAGGACPPAPPFGPSLTAGTVSSAAGAFSPFTLTLNRPDRNQYLSQLAVRMPPGLLGMLSSVQLCGEPRAAQGACPAASEVGTTAVAAGTGSQPLWETGHVFLTTGYKGAPFGLSVVVPAVAGPFNLGEVVVRAAINVDSSTGAITVTSDPFPQLIDGIPLRIQTVNVTIGGVGANNKFIFNPTSCAQQQIATTVTGAQGATATPSSPFAASGCRNLPFNPRVTIKTNGRTSKRDGASLNVKVTQAHGEAGIHRFELQLPTALPSRLSTLQQACPEAQFKANPAGCPPGSIIGSAMAITPVLNVPLTGPAYLVSYGGAAFPDLVFVLQANERGGRIRIDLVGHTDIKKGITYSRFQTVPDAPITSFTTTLPEGPHSVLGAFGNLCAKHLTAPATITGQNGAVLTQKLNIAVTGCPKAKKATKKAKHARKARRAPARGAR
jgi:uncharacterized repeat protein (TIGR01451 family)